MNTGYNINDPDIEMMDKDGTGVYYFNCATSKMWSKLFRCFYDEICEEYMLLRNGAFTLETMKKYLIEEQIDVIPIILYNQDQFSKYLSQGRGFLHMLHGRNREHIIRWLEQRIKYLDSLFIGIDSIYTSKSITIRSNNPDINGEGYTATLNIEPHYSQYITVKWRNGEFETHRVKKGQTQTYSFNMVNNTDNEVLVYSADNLKYIGSLTNMNPSSISIGTATGLVELDASSSPALLKVDVSKNTKLQKINLNNCSMLGNELGGSGANILDVRNCINLDYVDVRGTQITNVLNNSNGCAIKTLYLSENASVVRLVNYSRLKNFSCGTNIISFIAKDINLNLSSYITNPNIEELSIDNCNIGTLTSLILDGYRNTKTLVLKNMNTLKSVTFQYNRDDKSIQEPSYDDMGFTMEYFEISSCLNLENIYLGNRTRSDSDGAFGFNADSDSLICFTNLPNIKGIYSGGISGLKRMVIPQNLQTLTIKTERQSWSGVTYGDQYFYINDGGIINEKTQKCYTWDTVISEKQYVENPSLRGIISLIDLPNCVATFDTQTKVTYMFNNYEGVKINLKCSSSSNDFPSLGGKNYKNCVFVLSNTSASYPSSSYKRTVESIDFRTCTFDTTNYIKPTNPQYLGFKNCTFASFEQYMEILNKVYITGGYVGDSSILDRQPNTIESEEDVEIPSFSYTVTSTRTDYPFNGWTINSNIRFANDFTNIGYILRGAIINGNVSIHDKVTSATYLLYGSTINGKVIIDANCRASFNYFMTNAICEEAPLLPIGAIGVNCAFQNSTITKTPNNWDREYTTLVNDSTVNFNAYSGCNITQIAPIVDGVVGKYTDGSLDDIYIHWGGNKRYEVPKSQFEIVLTENDVPYTFTLSTTSEFLETYGENTNWGDGTTNTEDSHTYTEAGTYVIETSKIPEDTSFELVQRILYLQNNYSYFKDRSMFVYATNLKYINFGKPKTTPNYLFTKSSSLAQTIKSTELTIDLDCKNLTTLAYFMSSEGGGQSALTSTTQTITINLSNVGNITSTYSMLKFVTSKTININITDESTTGSLTNMSSMFYECSQLTTLDISSWDTSKVTNMSSMFRNCSQLTTLDVSSWNTSKVTNMNNMFHGCSKLTTLDISNWNTNIVTNRSNTFYNCGVINIYYNSSLTSSTLTYWMSTYSDKTWIDVSVQTMAEEINELQDESLMTMMALTELYETTEQNALKDSRNSFIEAIIPSIYVKLIRRGYKTIDDVPYSIQYMVEKLLNGGQK